MNTRTTRKTIVFYEPFRFDDLDGTLPAGSYTVESEEELLDTARVAYRRVATWLLVPAIGTRTTRREMIPVDPGRLDAAIAADVARLLER